MRAVQEKRHQTRKKRDAITTARITTKQSLSLRQCSVITERFVGFGCPFEVVHEHCSPWRCQTSCNEPSPRTQSQNTSDVSFTPDASVATAQSWCALLPGSLGHRPMKSCSRMFETFWHEQSCRAFSSGQLGTWTSLPIFVQAKERFESGDVEGGIELLGSLMSREVVNESTLMFARQVCESLGKLKWLTIYG